MDAVFWGTAFEEPIDVDRVYNRVLGASKVATMYTAVT
jgi:hypothetical protein